MRIETGDCLEVLRRLPSCFRVNCCVTSPPYFGLRDYGHAGQIGLETTPAEYVGKLVEVFREVRRILADDGTLWLNLGDTYARDPAKGDRSQYLGLHKNISDSGCHTASQFRDISGFKPKDLMGIPWRVAFALQADGWYLRSDIIWHKPNPMPESVTDRPTKAHEYLFLMSKSARYYYDAASIAEDSITNDPRKPLGSNGMWTYEAKGRGKPKDGERREGDDFLFRNRRTVWTVATQPFTGAHFATFPPDLIEPCIKAGCPVDGTVLDPFGGAGTTGLVADRLQRNALLIELNPDYAEMARNRITDDAPLFAAVSSGE